MVIVGLTGGIGSGKTIASRVFNILGVPIYNSDIQAKLLLNANTDVKNKITTLFGKEIYINDGVLNRKMMANFIFKDKNYLQKVNNIVHPAVENDFQNWLKQHSTKYVIKEAAILFESGSYKNCHKIITVYASKDIRIKRVFLRDKLSKDQIENRIKNQLDDNEKIRRSDYVINNNDDQLIISKIISIHNDILLSDL